MYYAQIKKTDVANGPGVRTSIFVSGCRHHCPGCFNEIAWAFDCGQPFTEQTQSELLSALRPAYIAGLTVLGGEPFEPENQQELLPFLKKVRAEYPAKTIWCFTGFTFEELLGNSRAHCAYTAELLRQIDVLVDGRYDADKRDLMLQFRGSSNQRVIDVPKTLAGGAVTIWKDLKY